MTLKLHAATSGIHWNHPRIEVATLLQFLPVAAGRKTVPQDPNGIGGTIHPNDMTVTLELLRIGGTATLTHYLVSFCQTVFHQRLGHRRFGTLRLDLPLTARRHTHQPNHCSAILPQAQ